VLPSVVLIDAKVPPAAPALNNERRASDRPIVSLVHECLPGALPVAVPRLLRRFAAIAPGVRVPLEIGAARPLLESGHERRLYAAIGKA
jgi:hypothetical protein